MGQARQAEVTDAGELDRRLRALDREPRPGASWTTIERYNEDDCISTLELRDWLLRAARRGRARAPRPPNRGAAARGRANRTRERRAPRGGDGRRLAARLPAGLPERPRRARRANGRPPAARAPARVPPARGAPGVVGFFARLAMTDGGAASRTPSRSAGSSPTAASARADKKSLVHTFAFPPQESQDRARRRRHRPGDGRSAGTVLAVDDAAGTAAARSAGRSSPTCRCPRRSSPAAPTTPRSSAAALRRLRPTCSRTGSTARGRYARRATLLLRRRCRASRACTRRAAAGQRSGRGDRTGGHAGLDHSHLFVQGPPGSGKTLHRRPCHRRPARGGASASASTALSHRAIHNLLDRGREGGARAGSRLRGAEEVHRATTETVYVSEQEPGFIANIAEKRRGLAGGLRPARRHGVALLARGPGRRALDYLFVDEAGQIALADALAVGTLRAQPGLPRRPAAAGAGLAGRAPRRARAPRCSSTCSATTRTIPPERGLFLDETWRMHPDVCGFVSEVDLRGPAALRGPARAPARRRAGPLAGTGLRFLPVEHAGNAQRSAEEAEAMRAALEDLLRGSFTDHEGGTAAADARRHHGRDARTTPRCASSRDTLPDGRAGRDGGQVPGPGGRRSSSSRWPPRAARSCRAAWSSCSAATGSTSRSRAPGAGRAGGQPAPARPCAATPPTRCAWSTRSAASWRSPGSRRAAGATGRRPRPRAPG